MMYKKARASTELKTYETRMQTQKDGMQGLDQTKNGWNGGTPSR